MCGPAESAWMAAAIVVSRLPRLAPRAIQARSFVTGRSFRVRLLFRPRVIGQFFSYTFGLQGLTQCFDRLGQQGDHDRTAVGTGHVAPGQFFDDPTLRTKADAVVL